MENSTPNLPDDPAQLKDLCQRLCNENIWLKENMQRLEEMLRLLRHQRFGAKSEQILHPGMQALFASEEPGESKKSEKTQKISEHTRVVRPRQPFPESLPRIDQVVDLPEGEKICSCCGSSDHLKKVSEKISEKLNIVPATLSVIRFIRPVFSCQKCETMRAAPMPPHPIPKCSVTVEALAHIAVSKYLDSLPLYRQNQIYLRSGVDIGRDKMAKWMIEIADSLRPIHSALHQILLQGSILHMDETTMQVLKEKDRLPTSKSYMVAQARGGPPGHAAVVFHYSPSRSMESMSPLLNGFKGILLTDGLEVYNSFAKTSQNVMHAGCWSHARRKFAEAQKGTKVSGRKGNLAAHGLTLIDKLFALESEIKDLSPNERLEIRKTKSILLVDELKAWVASHVDSTPSKALVGLAIRYLRNQWNRLVKFLDDGNIPLHNNFIENAIRPFALGRKNWLFSDSENGAEANAILYSLIVTAKVNGLSPMEYLSRAMIGIASGKSPKDLLPFAKTSVQ